MSAHDKCSEDSLSAHDIRFTPHARGRIGSDKERNKEQQLSGPRIGVKGNPNRGETS